MAPGSQMWLFFTFLPLFCCEFNNSGFDFLFWLQNRDGNVSLFSDVAQKINCDTNGEINYRLKINELQLWLKVFTFKKVASRNNLEEQRSAGIVFFFFSWSCHKDNDDTTDRCHRGQQRSESRPDPVSQTETSRRPLAHQRYVGDW